MRPVEYDLRTTDDLVTNAPHLATDARHCMSNAMCRFQPLRNSHPNFLLRQVFEPLKGILDVPPSYQPLQKLFLINQW